jgi:hypothetical protein
MVSADQDRPPCANYDGVVRYTNDGDDKKDHEIAEDFQTGAEPEKVHLQPGQRENPDNSSSPSREQPP